ncbi:chromo (CHRromatin organization MOdifier) domain-containing protein [Ditylenchus destructor]|nr:chromo (CHRromatin organization MOdifier) domain-containing protein [Ditylenchus destructor]
MQVFIRCSQTGKKIPLEVGTSDVNKVKSKVHKMLGVPSDRLFIAGNQLDDGRTLSDVAKKKNSVDRRRVDESDLEMSVDSASEKTAPSSGTSTSSTQFGTVSSKRATQSETPAPKKPTPNTVRESKSKSQKAKSTPRSKKGGKKATASPDVVVLSDDAPELFHVERVLDMRNVRGKREFLVHWKGYREDEATWEPEKNLGLAKKLVADYLKKADNKRNSLKATPKSVIFKEIPSNVGKCHRTILVGVKMTVMNQTRTCLWTALRIRQRHHRFIKVQYIDSEESHPE